jgi:protein involved in polysaccharide export with SLBB domain
MSLKQIFLFIENLILYCFIIFSSLGFSQQEALKKDQYQIGPDERLLITVHIWGEVRKPGEYLVPDDTDLLELISKAGGPTEFSNLSNIKITRGLSETVNLKQTSNEKIGANVSEKLDFKNYNKQVIKIDLKKILDKEKYQKTVPILRPGDVVSVGRNTWFAWQAVIRVASQIAIIVQAWYWYSRIE